MTSTIFIPDDLVRFFSSNFVTQFKLFTLDKLSSAIFCCLSVCQASVTPNQISTFSNIYRHTSPLLTMYHLIPSSTNLYWPSTSQYRHILTQYHQVPLIIHHLVRHSSVNWIISLFMTHLMSHAQYTRSSFILSLLSYDDLYPYFSSTIIINYYHEYPTTIPLLPGTIISPYCPISCAGALPLSMCSFMNHLFRSINGIFSGHKSDHCLA